MFNKTLSENSPGFFKSILIASLLLVMLPFLFVKYLPATDLPQHLAQIRLVEDIIENPQQSEYAVNWYGANSLVYILFGLNWIIFAKVLAGKITVLVICLCWCISIFLLARRARRSPIAAMLASIFIFNASLYWGLLNFLAGWPIFVLWYLFVIDPKNANPPALKEILSIFILSIILFFAHTLWLAAAVLVLFIVDLRRKLSFNRIWFHTAGLIPIGIYSVIWYMKLIETRTMLRFNMDAYWLTTPLERLDPRWIVNTVFCGGRGIAEIIVYIGIMLWIVLCVISQWKQFRSTTNFDFVAIGLLFVFFSFLVPDRYVNTLFFASRWLPVGLIFLVLGIPSPRIPVSISLAAGILLVTILSVSTTIAWSRFEKIENSGLEESLNNIPDGSRVLGLDFVKESQFIYGRPFLQTFAYAQVLHGGTLNFSFASHHSGIVSYAKIDTIRKWTSGLEWFAEWIKLRDFQFFDYALVNANDERHSYLAQQPVLEPVTTYGTWRLYQCKKDSSIAQRNTQLE